jgi:hypothetical protein
MYPTEMRSQLIATHFQLLFGNCCQMILSETSSPLFKGIETMFYVHLSVIALKVLLKLV